MTRQSIWSGLLSAVAIVLAGCASTVPEDESKNVLSYEKQIEAASGFAAEQSLIATLAPKLKSSAAACNAFKSNSSALASQCVRVSAVAYYLLGQSSDAENAQVAARDGMQGVASAAASLCVPPVTDSTTASNCEVIKSYTSLLDTRLMTTGLQSLAQIESPKTETLVATLTDFNDAIARDWSGARTSIQMAQQEKMACALYAADDQLAVSLSNDDDWPSIKNASNGALIQASEALQLPVCRSGSANCDAAACEVEPDGVSCQRQRLKAIGLLCKPGTIG